LTIRQRLLIWMVGSISLVYVAVLGFEFFNLKETANQQADARYRESLESRASVLADELSRSALAAQEFAESVSLAAAPETAAVTQAERLLVRSSIITAVEWKLQEGSDTIARGRFPALKDGGATQALPYAEDIAPQAWFSFRPDDTWRRAVWMTNPVDQGERSTRALVEISANAFAERLAEPIVDRSLLLLLDDKGRYLWHYNSDVMDSDVDIFSFARDTQRPSIAEAARTALSGEGGKSRMPRGFVTPEPYLIYFHPVGQTRWTLVTAVPEAELLAPVYAQLLRSMTVLVVGLLLIVAAVWLTARRITAPIERISEAARHLGEGRPYESAAKGAPRELRLLDNVLSHTSEQLKALTQQQIEEVARREFAEGELRTARTVQESLLPEPLPATQLEPFAVALSGKNLPASGVAGDFFDYLIDARGRLVVCIADVSGKGARAAMLMAVARTAFRTAADTSDHPGQVIASINDVVLGTTHDIDGSFITMQVVFIEPDGRITYANAGHPSATLVLPNGSTRAILNTTGTVVGAFADAHANAPCEKLVLEDDWHAVVLVTDGVLEATCADQDAGGPRQMFSEAGLQQTLETLANHDAQQIVDELIQVVRDFEGDTQTDDITVVAIVRQSKPAELHADDAGGPIAIRDTGMDTP
jgi:serine phosphatase RsbU (regulator of sigma subunit)